jgi:hypothetical protein
MAINVERPQFNILEKLSELDKPSGIAGEAMLRANTPQEQQALIGVGRRNLIINGEMVIDQRGITPFTSASGIVLDRWRMIRNYGDWSITQQSGHAEDTGHDYALKVDCTASASMGSTSYAEVQTRLEGRDLQGLQWGGSKAKPVTLSFWVKSNVTGLYSVSLYQSSDGQTYVASYNIDSKDTWEYKTITIPALTTHSIVNTNGRGLQLEFWVGLGTAYQRFTEGWGSTGYGINGQVNLMGDTSNEWLLTGVQLEVGSVATPFEHRSYGEELALCERYYQTSGNSTAHRQIWTGVVVSGNTYYLNVNLHTQMRDVPAVTLSNIGSNAFATPNAYPRANAFRVLAEANDNDNRGYYEFNWTADAEL